MALYKIHHFNKMNYSVYNKEYSALIRKGELTSAQALAALDLIPGRSVGEIEQ